MVTGEEIFLFIDRREAFGTNIWQPKGDAFWAFYGYSGDDDDDEKHDMAVFSCWALVSLAGFDRI
jgi:hypothetical protein